MGKKVVRMRLVYIEKFLEEYLEEVDYAEYSRIEPRYDWNVYLKIEEYESLKEIIERVRELFECEDYDYEIEIIGVFNDKNKRIYTGRHLLSEISV